MSKYESKGQAFVKRLYYPRIIGLGLGFCCVASVFFQKETHVLTWLGLIANGFLWPHVAYLIAKSSRDPYDAEIRNLLIDSFLGGLWVPLMSFNLLPSATVIFMMSMDNISVGGVRLFAKGALAQLTGGLLAVLFFGLNIRPESNMLNVLACIPMLAVFPLSIGIITYRLAKKLSRQKKEIEKINIEIKDSNVKLNAAYEGVRESEKRYRTLYESSRDGIVKIDMEDRFVEFNPSYLEMLGYTSDELIGRSYKEITPPQWEAKEDRIVSEQVICRGYSDVYEKEYIRKDGTTISVELRVYLLKENSENVGIWGIVRDITERKRMEAALREASEERYRILMENAGEAIFVVQDGVLRSVNTKTEELIGYTRKELTSRYFIDFIHPDDRAQVLDRYFKNQQGGGVPSRFSFRLVHRSGETLWTELNVVFIEWDGKPATLNFLSDITDLKRKEEEKQILEDRLQRAEKMEALGTLAGGVAHDLNNVLGIVVGYAELLHNKIDASNPLRNHVMYIMEGAESAAAIVQDLLTLARRGVQNKMVINLNTTIIDFSKSPEFLKLSSSHPNVQIMTSLEADLLNITGSPVHLGKTVMNMVNNAVEAMPNGGLLSIMTSNRYLDRPVQGYDDVREGDYVVLSVSDTGEGIPAADLKRIFEPFYTKKFMGKSGTGLGLAVVWGTVKDHNGYINVESVEGRGTTFTLYFPVTRESLSEDRIRVSVSKYMGNGERILVVDDVAGQCDLASQMLNMLNYHVATVGSGEDAVEYVKNNRVDLIVLDMIMDPGIDGLDTYKKILEINPKQKAIIVSGFSETDRVRKAQELGAGTYVRKPYVLEKIGLAIRKELDRN